jgi:hypothetical protein
MSLSFAERRLGGHLKIGPVTIYGENAMHWGVNISTKRWGYVCFRLPFRCFGRWWPLYFYVSPNATPWAATFYLGRNNGEHLRLKSRMRREAFGHNFDTDENYPFLREINDWYPKRPHHYPDDPE